MRSIFESAKAFAEATGTMTDEQIEAAHREWDEHVAEIQKQVKGKQRTTSRKAA